MSQAYKLIIEDDEGKRSVVPVDLGQISIGRNESSTIRLNERNVSRNHARLVSESGNVFAEDLDSYNGVYINGDRITERHPIHDGDLIRVGDFYLELRGEGLLRRTQETTQRTVVPDLEGTDPAAQLEEDTQVSAPMPEPVEAEATAPSETTAEPTAIIRLDQMQGLEDQQAAPGALSGERPRLICVSTNFAGNEYEITTSEAVIGRTEDNDIAIDHRSVSRHHAKIVTAGLTYRIVDLGSANGTLVNDEQYAQLALKAGDLIELGHVKFRFVPPGSTYTLSAEEQNTIGGNASGRPTTVPNLDPMAQPDGLMGAAKHNPLGAIAVTALLFTLLVLVGWLITSEDGEVEFAGVATDLTDTIGDGAQMPREPSSGPAEKILTKAKEMMAKRQWRKALKLVNLAVQTDPESDEALELLEVIEGEMKAKRSYEVANRAIKEANWNAAWNALNDVPQESVYTEDVAPLREQVRGALITKRVADANAALDSGKRGQAAEIAAEIEALDASNPQLTILKAKISQAGGSASASQASHEPASPRSTTRSPPPGRSQRTSPAKTAKNSASKVGAKKPYQKKKQPTGGISSSAPAVDVRTLLKDGIGLLQSGKTQAAIDKFSKCVQIDRSACQCYRAMGISYARAGNGPKAARYYRLYLKYCPNAKDAAQVKKLLDAYGN